MHILETEHVVIIYLGIIYKTINENYCLWIWKSKERYMDDLEGQGGEEIIWLYYSLKN